MIDEDKLIELRRIATALEKLTADDSPLLSEIRGLGKSVLRLSDNISRLHDGVARAANRL